MFGSKDKENKSVETNALLSHSHNSLVKGTIVEGKVTSQNDIRIDGTIKGALECNAKLVVGPVGVIEGEISCKNAVIMGRIEGNISVKEMLKLEKTASVTGEIVTSKFIVAAGAVFNGTCKMGKHEANVSIVKKGKGAQQKVAQLKKEAI